MEMRRDLAKLVKWRGPATEEAILLARAIEATMNFLFPLPPKDNSGKKGGFTWALTVKYNGMYQPIQLQIEWDSSKRTWKTYADEIEAVLSLWLFSVEKPSTPESESDLLPSDDTWVRAEGLRSKPALWLLGQCEPRLIQDLRWWMPKEGFSILEAKQNLGESDETLSNSRQLDIEKGRVVGCRSLDAQSNQTPSEEIGTSERETRWAVSPLSTYEEEVDEDTDEDAVEQDKRSEKDHTFLTVESHNTLEKLYARDMFRAFVQAAAQKMEREQRVDDHSEIQAINTPARPREAWKFFTLRSKRLSKLALDIKETGFESLHNAYLCQSAWYHCMVLPSIVPKISPASS
ncbi:hypothetical protein ACHAPT_006177 [Fusarium lateritium]